jgi:hypothetical protein
MWYFEHEQICFLYSGLRCNDDLIRGVNAGGWLVLEAWMTPSIFADFNSVASKNLI